MSEFDIGVVPLSTISLIFQLGSLLCSTPVLGADLRRHRHRRSLVRSLPISSDHRSSEALVGENEHRQTTEGLFRPSLQVGRPTLAVLDLDRSRLDRSIEHRN